VPQTRLPVAAARLPAFLLLGAFGARAWAQMVEPAASGAVVAALLAALAGGAVLAAVARRRPRRGPRAAATLLVAVVLLLVALAAAGVPDLVRPHAWDDLAAGIGHGLSAVPGVRVPYRGDDAWTRTVIVLGCVALVVVAALLAFAPRRDGALGFPIAAAIALGTLYAVPTMQHGGAAHPFLAGAVFAVLLAVFLWLERVERRTVPMAAGVVAAAILVALVAAPRLAGAGALLDYERLARSLGSSSTRYDWNHDYGPLSWPRDGHEVLRVGARDRAYWKAADLTAFDGRRWVQAPRAPGAVLDAGLDRVHPRWRQTLRVTVRGLSSSQFVAAGTTLGLVGWPRATLAAGPGVFATRDTPLTRGDSYRAVVYTPRPSARDLRAATRRPLPAATDATSIVLPATRGARARLVTITPWGRGATPRSTVDALRASPYGPAYELVRRLRARSASPYELMRAVERRLSRGYAYSEDPRSGAAPLADFLFGDRSGYCQQFSGAMALLLRLGGVPARVAAGFAPGVLDRRRHEYVVRDLDAHSWVEVFFPGIGWVTRDPTPADSPARSQVADVARASADAAVAPPDARRHASGQRAPDAPAGAAAPATERPRSPAIVAGLVLAGALAAIGLLALMARRRRRSPGGAGELGAEPLAELHRALRRSGRPPAPQTTLEALAVRYRGSAAEGYVRALTAVRYGYGEAPPTAAQRAALRRELAFGLGPRGLLRAWWALPPRAPAPRARGRPARERASDGG
jgi:transglutaminase-like putative cysteine protease